ncbi:MAG: hypothetical protein U5M23_08620 [Marinagarivorans sp.]|nr:hypothetical protein [Marinagarivorans sp.]
MFPDYWVCGFACHGSTDYDAEGGHGAIETMQDVSERKAAERLPAELRLPAKGAAQCSASDCGIGMAILDFERIVFANDALARIWGGTVRATPGIEQFYQSCIIPDNGQVFGPSTVAGSAVKIFFQIRYDTTKFCALTV